MPGILLRIFVKRDRISQRGPMYTARLHSPAGDIIATGTMEPALAAARALIARSHDPASVLEMWDIERPYPRLRGQLGVMARQTVMEGSAGSGPRFAKYNPVETRFRQDTASPKEGFGALGATDHAPAREPTETPSSVEGDAASS